jgi:hypothetical protein
MLLEDAHEEDPHPDHVRHEGHERPHRDMWDSGLLLTRNILNTATIYGSIF